MHSQNGAYSIDEFNATLIYSSLSDLIAWLLTPVSTVTISTLTLKLLDSPPLNILLLLLFTNSAAISTAGYTNTSPSRHSLEDGPHGSNARKVMFWESMVLLLSCMPGLNAPFADLVWVGWQKLAGELIGCTSTGMHWRSITVTQNSPMLREIALKASFWLCCLVYTCMVTCFQQWVCTTTWFHETALATLARAYFLVAWAS